MGHPTIGIISLDLRPWTAETPSSADPFRLGGGCIESTPAAEQREKECFCLLFLLVSSQLFLSQESYCVMFSFHQFVYVLLIMCLLSMKVAGMLRIRTGK